MQAVERHIVLPRQGDGTALGNEPVRNGTAHTSEDLVRFELSLLATWDSGQWLQSVHPMPWEQRSRLYPTVAAGELTWWLLIRDLITSTCRGGVVGSTPNGDRRASTYMAMPRRVLRRGTYFDFALATSPAGDPRHLLPLVAWGFYAENRNPRHISVVWRSKEFGWEDSGTELRVAEPGHEIEILRDVLPFLLGLTSRPVHAPEPRSDAGLRTTPDPDPGPASKARTGVVALNVDTLAAFRASLHALKEEARG
jgi:hypothetical protein